MTRKNCEQVKCAIFPRIKISARRVRSYQVWNCLTLQKLARYCARLNASRLVLQIFAKVAKELLHKSSAAGEPVSWSRVSAPVRVQKRLYNPFRADEVPQDPYQQVSDLAGGFADGS